jgi:SAM-dependent methyltransferase
MKSIITRDMGSDINNRGVFNEQAQLYARVRPYYPEALFDVLVRDAHLSKDAALLEIGPGTGQATASMAKRGYDILAIELGENLARIAKEKLSTCPNVRIIVDTFENAELDNESFDLVYSATAFHWLKPEVRYKKTHRILRPGGHLAIIQTNHVSDNEGDSFYNATQPIYDKFMPIKKDADNTLPRVKDLRPVVALDTELFKQIDFDYFPLVVTYNANDYTDLIGTYSPILALPNAKREQFLKEIKNLVEARFNNKVTKHYSMSLALAKKI